MGQGLDPLEDVPRTPAPRLSETHKPGIPLPVKYGTGTEGTNGRLMQSPGLAEWYIWNGNRGHERSAHAEPRAGRVVHMEREPRARTVGSCRARGWQSGTYRTRPHIKTLLTLPSGWSQVSREQGGSNEHYSMPYPAS
ncbi:Hypothetical predicted protein [Pelobates cultripes]|uniref:Uncharacterized protein n=1 Tax=Pelobates cultripes TaxID=61616 RepID=A0AAD1RX03_PELCU|nr:Hypothetical predicted protein [Pelobates cultripes]